MAGDEEKPLDPAVERVRRRLIRFMAINLGILFIAFAIVLGAIVYKLSFAHKENADQAQNAQLPTGGEPISADIPLPTGAKLISTSLSGSAALLEIALPDASRMLIYYDLAKGHVIGRYALKTGPQ